MPRRDDPKSNRTGQSGDNFQKIAGIGPVLAQRLWNAGILTYDDLARRTPAEIAAMLANVAGISAERIASQNWTGQARELGGPPPEASVPRQHYAAFHIEFLLESDNRVRRTKVRHHQRDAGDAWPGWDEGRLLSFLRDRIQLPAATMAVDTSGPEPAHMQTQDQEPASTQDTPTSQPSPSVPEQLPSLSLSIEELAPVRDGQRSYLQNPCEPNSVRLTMRISPTGPLTHDTFEFSATIAARTFGGHDRSPLGTTQGVIRVSDPLSVEVAGPALPVGLYRLMATVDIYPAGHSPKQQPLHSQSASGDLMGVADTPPRSASAVA
jgi:helix-hairpin-helix protein